MHLGNLRYSVAAILLQIIECRRVLKWTYAYGYYLPNHENAKRQLFEYLQGKILRIAMWNWFFQGN